MFDIGGLWSRFNLWKSIKEFDFNGVLSAIRSFPFDWVEIGSCGGIGLLSGFLFKRYFKTFAMVLIVGGIVIALLDNLGYIHIDWNSIQQFIGFEPTQAVFSNFFHEVLAWAKINKQGMISFVVGFIVGLKFS